MLLLISDANILIDMESGELMGRLFRLPMQFAIPDVLYWEEIELGTPGLQAQGLQILEVTSEYVQYAFALQQKYGSALSLNDHLALALAKQEGCPLLTGDHQLKVVAQAENVSVMGTVWLLRRMIEHRLLKVDESLAALALMKAGKRRLPWADAERILNAMRLGFE